MKNCYLVVVVSILCIISNSAFSAGSFCTLPTAPTGSAYINAYNEGRVIPPVAGPGVTVLQARMNFGTTTDGGTAGACEITGIPNDSAAPLPSYGILPVISAVRIIPSVTGGATSIGQIIERIWRKPAASSPVTATDMCILGTKVSSLNSTDHDPNVTGIPYFKINDITRGGFANSGNVNVGYLKSSANSTRTYRIGRTFTSVQHRAYKYGGNLPEQQSNGLGYLDLPTIGGSSTLNINGVNSPIGPTAVATTGGNSSLQEAQVNINWVDFTTDSIYMNFKGTQKTFSAMNYIEFPCNSDNGATINSTWVKEGAIRLRQTAQEDANFKEISIQGYAPPGATLP